MRYGRIVEQLSFNRFYHLALIAVTILAVSLSAAQTAPAAPDLPKDFKDPELLAEFGRLVEKMQRGVDLPPARSQSRLLTLLPESTIFYAAFSNYGDASRQALKIFQQEVRENPRLRAWWQHGDLATTGPKIEDSLQKFYQLSEYLGDEIVVSATAEGRQDPGLLILAEVRNPGLREFLQKSTRELAGKSKPGLLILDVHELAITEDTTPPQSFVILVRPDLVAAALSVATLRKFNSTLERKSQEFAASSFEHRIAQVYEGGVTVVGAADVERILKEIPQGTAANQEIVQRTGIADARYLIWEHKNHGKQSVSEMELSFTGPRHGVAAWLAAPAHLGSLDFVSPKAMMVAAVSLRDPAQIFEEVKELATVSNPNAFASLAQMEQAMRVSLKDDVLRGLRGEVTVEVDEVVAPGPAWRAILSVADGDHLQATLSKLLATAPLGHMDFELDGVNYHTLRIPSAQKVNEIGYAFVDGYLVIASSRKGLIEAVQLHRSGASLAKSKRFLDSLPQGHSTEMSAMFLQDPFAMMALRMQQVPELAALFSHLNTDGSLSVSCAYGEERAIRGISQTGGVDAGAIMIAAAIAIPNLLRARIAANESSAVGTTRMVNVAQLSYFRNYPQRGFARNLAALGPGDAGGVSPDHASLIDATLGNSSCIAGAWCVKSGFQFSITTVCRRRCDEYVVTGTPVSSGTGSRNFCSTSDGVIRSEMGPPLTSPISAAECLAWPPLQ